MSADALLFESAWITWVLFPSIRQQSPSILSAGSSIFEALHKSHHFSKSKTPGAFASGRCPDPIKLGREGLIIATGLADFDYESSPIWQMIRRQFSSGVRHRELLSVASVLCSLVEPLPLPSRTERRSFPLLIRWFRDNWAAIRPVFPLIHLCDDSRSVINFQRERRETMERGITKVS
jgi:hypothetical protein